MVHELRRFAPFAGLNREMLRAVSRHASVIEVPAGRWLVQRGRVLSGSHFLLRGSVRTVDPDRVIQSGDRLAREAVYPGVAGVRTLTACRLLQLTDEAWELLATERSGPLAAVAEVEDCWQARFLRTQLLMRLPLASWQKVLSRLKPLSVDADQILIAEGTPHDIDSCFILAAGHAEVSRRHRVLCRLQPGDLFGEDALISRQPRNASVRMVESGLVMSLQATDFREFLGEVLDTGGFHEPDCLQYSNAPREQVLFDSTLGLRERIAGLDECVTYLVSSGSAEICALAVFLMRKRGLKAWAVSR